MDPCAESKQDLGLVAPVGPEPLEKTNLVWRSALGPSGTKRSTGKTTMVPSDNSPAITGDLPVSSAFNKRRRKEDIMADLKIRVFKEGDSAPDTTVTIPGGLLKIASKLIPKQARGALQEKGIDLDEIIKLSENPDARGTLVEVEEHKKNERIVIALE
jgi:hypothetical protein